MSELDPRRPLYLPTSREDNKVLRQAKADLWIQPVLPQWHDHPADDGVRHGDTV